MQSECQCDILDRFGGTKTLATNVRTLFHRWQQAKTEFQLFETQAKEAEQKKDFLDYQIQELAALNLTTEALDQLEQEHHRLSHAETILGYGKAAYALLSDENLTGSHTLLPLLNKLSQACQGIQALDETFKEPFTLIETARIQLMETKYILEAYLSQVDINPNDLQQLEKRLSDIHKLATKHRVSEKALPKLYQNLLNESQSIEANKEQRQVLAEKIRKIEIAYDTEASELSKRRSKTAETLAEAITKNLTKLGMTQARFEIRCISNHSKQPTLGGFEKISFFIQTNPDHPPQPLIQIASGGELSRICLAIQAVIAKFHQLPTMIFDEVDSGIGGAVAEIVGHLLRQLGETAQVLCITHLPQVAALGHNHQQVSKQTQKGITHTTIRKMTGKDRVREIARMLGGIEPTVRTLALAKEMLLFSSK
jgi:DNA repair protein RecN (Recombination protein N)